MFRTARAGQNQISLSCVLGRMRLSSLFDTGWSSSLAGVVVVMMAI